MYWLANKHKKLLDEQSAYKSFRTDVNNLFLYLLIVFNLSLIIKYNNQYNIIIANAYHWNLGGFATNKRGLVTLPNHLCCKYVDS